MVSRMEKYYQNDTSSRRRTSKNVDLYHDIYSASEYSNIEGIATMDKNNEIDITKVRNTLNRENYKKQRQLRQLKKQEPEDLPVTTKDFVEDEVRNYDIRDVLSKAILKKPVEDTPRSLDNTNYNILKSLKLHKDEDKEIKEKNELKELINTITNTSMLNKMNDNELGLNMLDLAETNTKLNTNETVKQLLEEAKKQVEKSKEADEIDKSFFTSSLNFTKEDFEDANEMVKQKKSKKIFKRIVLFTVLLFLTVSIIFGVYIIIK